MTVACAADACTDHSVSNRPPDPLAAVSVDPHGPEPQPTDGWPVQRAVRSAPTLLRRQFDPSGQ